MCRIIAAMRPTLASTRLSEEISFVMNPKSALRPVSELGPDADAFEAAHDAIAGADLAEFPAHRAARHQHDDGIHALTFDFEPGTTDPDVGALVGRGVEVVRHAAVLLGHAHGGILHVDRVAAEWQELLEEILQRRSARRLHLQREPRVLVVRATELEVLNLERAAALDDLVEDRLELLRVDEVAFSGDDGGMSVGHDGFGESTPSRPSQEEGRREESADSSLPIDWLAPRVARPGGREGPGSQAPHVAQGACEPGPSRPSVARLRRAMRASGRQL